MKAISLHLNYNQLANCQSHLHISTVRVLVVLSASNFFERVFVFKSVDLENYINAGMEKEGHQPDSLATVTIKPDYAPSESFTSEPPPVSIIFLPHIELI